MEDPNADQTPLGTLQKGSIDILGAKVTTVPNPDRIPALNGMDWLIRIEAGQSGFSKFEVSIDRAETLALTTYSLLAGECISLLPFLNCGARITAYSTYVLCFQRWEGARARPD